MMVFVAPVKDQFKITEESCPRLVILLRAAASWWGSPVRLRLCRGL